MFLFNTKTEIDTTPYRRTLWNHVQSLFGVCHDDFRYEYVDKLFTRPQQTFLKLCATRPYEILSTGKDALSYNQIMPFLAPSEVVHLILMIMDAREQACLLHIAHAISDAHIGA
ncbi:unnamed protein product [Protopolystoma xenopodis]|uniref:Uncharacterized protein n=1 Tax=Protopolystoma xenopodis TaxID=117903 RepID=A0A3S5C3F8_9PLAT|nr:unnamed protein product [Protopolystoma xenopodis]